MTSSKQKTRFFGILGLDPIVDEENKLGGYKTVVSSQPKGGKVVLKREYTYGLDEKLYTSEIDREKIKNRFNNFMKKVDLDLKLTDSYIHEMKNIRSLRNSSFGKKPEDQPMNGVEIEAAFDAILKKKSQKKADEEHY